MKLLLIDDEAFALKLLTHQLAALGATDVTTSQSAVEALALLANRDEHFDIVFCDLQMPDVDGIEFVRALAATSFDGELALASGEVQHQGSDGQ